MSTINSTYRIDNTEYGIKSDGSDSTATTNGLQNALNYASSAGCRDVYLDAGTYAIDCTNQIQVYDKTAYCGIRIPSGIHLHLDPNTVLKAQANGLTDYAMICFCDAADAGLYGGKLYGDRDSHDFSASGTHEACHVIAIRISSYITVKNVQIYQPTGDGIIIGGFYAYGQTGYMRPNHIVVDGCVIDGARRNNISVIDGEYMQIVNNTIQNAGTVNGTNPKAGMDVEPNYNESVPNWQRAENVFIKNNTFKGNSANDLILHGGRTTKITVENNVFESASSLATVLLHCNMDVRFCNNMLVSDTLTLGLQVDYLPTSYTDTKQRIIIANNQLVNMSMYLNGDEILVSGNEILNANMDTEYLRNATISNNHITGGRIRVWGNLDRSNGTTFTRNINILGNRIENYNPSSARGAIITEVSSSEMGLLGITIRNNTIVDCGLGIHAVAGAGNIIIDSNAIYSTVDPDDENYKSVGFAISVSGYSDVVCTNNIISKTQKVIRYYARANTKSLNISNNIATAGNVTQAIYIEGLRTDDDVITPFPVRFANNVIKSLSAVNTFMLLRYLSGCKVLNNEIDSQSTYRPINSLNSVGTVYVNNITNGAFAKADSDTETGTVTL